MPAWMVSRLTNPRGSGSAATDDEWVRRFSGVERGTINETATKCAGYLAAKGLAADVIAQILIGYGMRCTPPSNSEEDVATFRGIAKRIWEKHAKSRQASASAPETSAAVVVRADTIAPEAVAWLWPGRIPRGKLTLLDRRPWLGQVVCAARPDGPRLAGSRLARCCRGPAG